MKTYSMHNFATGAHVKKTQKNEPKIKGYVCVAIERVMPKFNARGEKLFCDANQPYYAAVRADGSHHQP